MSAMVTPIPPPVDDRLARARSVLVGVEGRMGIAHDVVGGLSLVHSATDVPPALPAARLLPLDSGLASLIPGGALRRGTAISVEGSTSLVLALLAEASRQGSWAAILGLPHIGVVAAARRGIHLSRLALIPHPGAEAAAIAGACIDGMDIVVLGPRLALSDTDRRRLSVRARERGAVMVSVGAHPGAHVSLRVVRSEWTGLGAGEGRLRERSLTLSRSGRHLGGVDQVTVMLDSDVPPVHPARAFPGRAAQGTRVLRLA